LFSPLSSGLYPVLALLSREQHGAERCWVNSASAKCFFQAEYTWVIEAVMEFVQAKVILEL